MNTASGILPGFLLRKWNVSEPTILNSRSHDLKDPRFFHNTADYTKTLGIEWDVKSDEFHLTVAELTPLDNVTKWLLVSDITKTFDVLSPSIIKVKILLQRLWEIRLTGMTRFQKERDEIAHNDH